MLTPCAGESDVMMGENNGRARRQMLVLGGLSKIDQM
jgi:hypothetical protein